MFPFTLNSVRIIWSPADSLCWGQSFCSWESLGLQSRTISRTQREPRLASSLAELHVYTLSHMPWPQSHPSFVGSTVHRAWGGSPVASTRGRGKVLQGALILKGEPSTLFHLAIV